MLYKRYTDLIVITAIIIGCIFMSGCLNEEDQKNVFISYENTKYGVAIKYPDKWVKIENPSGDVMVTFMPDKDDVLKGALNISVTVNESFTIERFIDIHNKNLALTFTGYQVLFEDTTVLAGFDAYSKLFTFRNDEYIFLHMEIWTLINHTIYMLTYQAEEIHFDIYIETVEKIFDTFEIIR